MPASMMAALLALGFGLAVLGAVPLLALDKRRAWHLRAAAFIALTPIGLGAAGFGAVKLWMGTRIQPAATNYTLARGVQYERRVESNPSKLVWHVARIDLTAIGTNFMVTAGDPTKLLPFAARETTAVAKEQFAAVAISGDVFGPKFTTNPLVPGPISGDALQARGFSASRGMAFGKQDPNANELTPTLYLSETNAVSFGQPIGSVYNAISGDCTIVAASKPGKASAVDLTTCTLPSSKLARAAIGYNDEARQLILLVIDGDQASLSEGATAAMTADLLAISGARYGIALAPGPGATLAGRRENGDVDTLSSPVANGIGGLELPVANHLIVLSDQRLTHGN
jgi:hypothetical protein